MAVGMPQVYLHYFGNESSKSLLELYGIEQNRQQQFNILKPKPCPNCSESNKPDSKFCAKCRMVLKYDAYTETLEENQIKGKKPQSLEDSIRSLQESHREILEAINDIFNPIRNNDVNIACRSRGLGGEFEDD